MCALCVGACVAYSGRKVRYNGVVNQTEGKDNEQQQPAEHVKQMVRQTRVGVVRVYVGNRSWYRIVAYSAAFRPWHLVNGSAPTRGALFFSAAAPVVND